MSNKKCFFLKSFIKCFLTTITCLVSGCTHIFDVDILVEGIEKYSPGLSSVGLCSYLTLRDENYDHFLDNYNFINGYFKYTDLVNGALSCETAIMVLNYEDTVFQTAYANIEECEGYSSEIEFVYKGYIFNLNETERLMNINYLTSFSFEEGDDYIRWINLVGVSRDKKSIAFIGFFYSLNHDFLRKKNKSKPYSFSNWNNLFETYFSEYNWGNAV